MNSPAPASAAEHTDEEVAPLSPSQPCTAPPPGPRAWHAHPAPLPSLGDGGACPPVYIPLAQGSAPRGGPCPLQRDFCARLLRFSGPGVLVCVGYMDPGNWATGLRAGAGWGYAHLFIVLLSSTIGMFLQVLTVRLGVAGKRDLAQACRDALPRPLALALWLSAELAMAATDLAEVIGFAVAFQLLTGLPVWAGVALSTGDTLLLFLLPSGAGLRQRIVEGLSLLLVLVIALAFAVLLGLARPPPGQVLAGYLPSAQLFRGEGLLVALGILGATVMPHNLYLHSAMVRLRVVGSAPEEGGGEAEGAEGDAAAGASREEGALLPPSAAALAAGAGRGAQAPSLSLRAPSSDGAALEEGSAAAAAPSATALGPPHPPPTLDPCVTQTIELGAWDAVLSLASAAAVNSAIVIVASASFHAGVEGGAVALEDAGSLQGAYRLLAPALGPASSVLFATALLASGQSSTFTGTMAGQVVMEGFLELRLPTWVRRLVTRSVAIVPAALTAALAGESGLNYLLVCSQVILSFQLPFAIVPLVAFVGSRERLGPYAASPCVAGLGWAVCALVIGLNCFMLLQLAAGGEVG